LAEPTSVPAGVYSKKFFERVGIWDALVSKKVKIAFEVPPAEGPVISYPFALVKGAPQEAAEVVALADEVILLESGRMRARGAPRDVLRDLRPEASGSPGRSCP